MSLLAGFYLISMRHVVYYFFPAAATCGIQRAAATVGVGTQILLRSFGMCI